MNAKNTKENEGPEKCIRNTRLFLPGLEPQEFIEIWLIRGIFLFLLFFREIRVEVSHIGHCIPKLPSIFSSALCVYIRGGRVNKIAVFSIQPT